MGIALVLTALGFTLYTVLRHAVIMEYRKALRTQAQALASMTEQHARHRIIIEMHKGNMPQFIRRRRAEYYEIWGRGQPQVRSQTLGRANLPALRPHGGHAQSGFARLPDGRWGLEVAIAVFPRVDVDHEHDHGHDKDHDHDRDRGHDNDQGHNVHDPDHSPKHGRHHMRDSWRPKPERIIVAAAGPMAPIAETLGDIQDWIIILCVAALALAAVVLSFTVSRALLPVNQLAAHIAALDTSGLGKRLALEEGPTELRPVVQRLNDLLDRLEATVLREKAFTADVAHELRTPLAGLRTTLEVCATRPRKTAEYQQAIAACLQMVGRMHAMVDNLLTMARAEAGQLQVLLEPVDLADLARECWPPFADRARERGLADIWPSEGPCIALTDREKLRLVLHNLFDNATNYADTGGRVLVDTRCESGSAVLSVSNSGSAVAPEEAEKVFDRFWRGDAARSADGLHAGLGLALVKRVMQSLGGGVAAEISNAGVFTVKVTLNNGSNERR